MNLFRLLLYSLLPLPYRALQALDSHSYQCPFSPCFLPINVVTPLVALTGTMNTVIIFIRHRRSFELKPVVNLVIGSLLGIPVGVMVLNFVDDYILKIILAVIIASYSVFALAGVKKAIHFPSWTGYIFGFFSGLFGSSLNTNGPPIIVYAALQKWEKDKIIVTLQGFFIASGASIIAGHGINGLISKEILLYFLKVLPVLFLGFLTGSFLYNKINQDNFRRIIYLSLIVLSVLLVVK
jgi:uncharacterized membrane protein YfcA